MYLPPTRGSARSPHGRASVENRHGEYNRRKVADKNRDGQETRDKCEMAMMKPNTGFREDGSAGDVRRRKMKSKEKRKKSKSSRKIRAGDRSSDCGNASHS